MRRILATVLSAIMVLTVVACDSNNKNNDSDSQKGKAVNLLSYDKPVERKNAKIKKINCLTQVLRAGKKCELELLLDTLDVNVFDPAEIALDITVSKDDEMLSFPGFFYRAYGWNEEGRCGPAVEGSDSWRFRIVVPEKGIWNYKIVLTQAGKETDELEGSLEFADKSEDYRGIIGVSKTDTRYFAFENGDVYIPMGHNVAWNTESKSSYSYIFYRDKIKKLAENGGNFIRIWMATWDLSLYSSNASPTDFSSRLGNASVLDRILDECNKNGVYVELALYHHGQFIATKTDAAWSQNPFNANRKNGYLEKAEDFWTDERAKSDAKCYLRYMVARYGYSDNILTWELGNEITSSDGEEYDIRNWCHEMAEYVRSIDMKQHMVTASTAVADSTFNFDKTFDFINIHWYGWDTVKDIMSKISAFSIMYKRPVLIAELGKDWQGDAEIYNETYLHQQILAGLFSCSAGSSAAWQPDLLDALPDDAGYKAYTVPAKIAAQIPFGKQKMVFITNTTAGLSDENLTVGGYKWDNGIYAWLLDNNYTPADRIETEYNGTELSVKLESGKYVVKWIDGWSGEIVSTENVDHNGGKILLTSPKWSKDIFVFAELA